MEAQAEAEPKQETGPWCRAFKTLKQRDIPLFFVWHEDHPEIQSIAFRDETILKLSGLNGQSEREISDWVGLSNSRVHDIIKSDSVLNAIFKQQHDIMKAQMRFMHDCGMIDEQITECMSLRGKVIFGDLWNP